MNNSIAALVRKNGISESVWALEGHGPVHKVWYIGGGVVWGGAMRWPVGLSIVCLPNKS